MGKAARKRYERQEREAWKSFVPGTSPGLTPTIVPSSVM